MIGRFINADTTDILTVSPTSLTDKNLYAYCDNNPVVRRDSSGYVWETVFDVLSLGASIMEVAFNPAAPFAWMGLAGDAADLIPFVTGVGETIRALKTVSKVAKGTDEAIDTYRSLKRLNKGNDLEVHHIVEKRFSEQLGYGSTYKKKKILKAAINVYSKDPQMLGAAIYTITKYY